MLVGWTFSVTPEEARVDDLMKAFVEIKFILFIEKTNLVSNIHLDKFIWTLEKCFPEIVEEILYHDYHRALTTKVKFSPYQQVVVNYTLTLGMVT